jgi:alpha-tubulin suppressor-like RCC1 family protein
LRRITAHLSTPHVAPEQFGQLGNGSTNAATAYVSSLVAAIKPAGQTGILTGATAVAAAGRPEAAAPSGHTCACLNTGEAVCWGYNVYGQVSQGSCGAGWVRRSHAQPGPCNIRA